MKRSSLLGQVPEPQVLISLIIKGSHPALCSVVLVVFCSQEPRTILPLKLTGGACVVPGEALCLGIKRWEDLEPPLPIGWVQYFGCLMWSGHIDYAHFWDPSKASPNFSQTF